MKKITVEDKYVGYAEFTPRRAGIFVFLVEKYLRIARVYKVKEEKKGKKKRKTVSKGYLPGTIKIQLHPHGTLERQIHKSNEWIPLPPDLILPLIKILQEWYMELFGKESPVEAVEEVEFKEVSDEKELSKDIEDIGLK